MVPPPGLSAQRGLVSRGSVLAALGPQPLTAAQLAAYVWVAVVLFVVGRGFLANKANHTGIYAIYAHGGADWVAGRNVYPVADGFDVFRYHPLFAAGFAPFGLLPVMWGSVLWRTFLVAMVYTSLRRWLKVAVNATADPRTTAAVLSLAAPLVAWDLIAGQTNALIVAFLLRAIAAAVEERWWPAALWLAVATLLKLFPLGFAVLMLVARPRQLGLRFIAAIVALSALPFLTQSPSYVASMYTNWFALCTADSGRQDWVVGLLYRDVRFLFRIWAEPLPEWAFRTTVLVFWTAAVVTVRVLATRVIRSADWRYVWALALALGGVGMTLLGPCTEVITYSILGPSLAIAAWQAGRGAGTWVENLLSWSAYLLMAAGFLAFLFPFGTDFSMLGPQAAAALLFAAALPLALFRHRRAVKRPLAPEIHFHLPQSRG